MKAHAHYEHLFAVLIATATGAWGVAASAAAGAPRQQGTAGQDPLRPRSGNARVDLAVQTEIVTVDD